MSHESRDDAVAILAMANFLAQTQGIPKSKNGQTSRQRLLDHAARTVRSAEKGASATAAKKKRVYDPNNAIIGRLV